MKKKRFLIVSNLYPSIKDKTYGTFVENFYNEFCKEFSNDRVDLCVIKGRANKICKLWKYICFYLKLTFYTLLFNYDLIYVHYITLSSIPLKFIQKFKHINIAFNIHGDDLLSKSRFAEKELNFISPLLFSSKLIIVPSFYFRSVFLKKFPLINVDNIYISPSGGIKKNFFIRQNKIRQSTLVLGYVSRIDEGKGWEIFLSAISKLKEHFKVKGYIAGTGKQVPEMIKHITQYGLTNIVKYLGPIGHEKLPSLYALLNLFVFPTQLRESLGLVGLEAMAASVPVVGSDIGGLKSYIVNGYNGYLFETGSSQDLYIKIIQYVNMSDEKKIRMGENAYRTALNYQSDVVSTKLFDKIRQKYHLN